MSPHTTKICEEKFSQAKMPLTWCISSRSLLHCQ